MACFVPLFLLCSMILTGAASGEDSIELLNLFETTEDISQPSELPLAVSVSNEDLKGVSTSVLMAESWLRYNVLGHYPAANITTVLVRNPSLCQNHQNVGLVLLSLKNLYHSLKRWGLEKLIKVSFAFNVNCFTTPSHETVKPLMEFLESVNSTYSLIPHSASSLSSVSSHLESMKKLGFLPLQNNINVVVTTIPKERRRKLIATTRKLSFPIRPTPFPEIAEPPLDFPVHSPSSPPNVAEGRNPMPPLAQVVSSPPPMDSNFPPQTQLPPLASPPKGFYLPPCSPVYDGSPSPASPEITVPVQKLWCVAKPHVPAETLQQALDYACGEGGANCAEITPQGSCYSPDTVVAHASYAFNSYWQKHKRHGGTCSFGGTAMLINSDPSYLNCRFVLS